MTRADTEHREPSQGAGAPWRDALRQWLTAQFEINRGGSASNIRSMEGIRGFAVFLVFVVHYATFAMPWAGNDGWTAATADALHALGNTGVDLFFLLSGFLIYGSVIRKPQPYLTFMVRRAQRIYPAFLAVFALYLVLSFMFPAKSKLPDVPLEAAIYIGQNLLLLPGLFAIEPIITVAWSLSYEMFFYLVIPGFVAVFGPRARTAGQRSTLFVGVALVGLWLANLYGGPVRLVLFIAGLLLFEALQCTRLRPPPAWLGFAGLCAGLASPFMDGPGDSDEALRTAVLFIGFFLFCFCCLGRPSGRLAIGFSWTPLRWLGNMSYSYYLLHGLALHGIFTLLGGSLLAPPANGMAFWIMALPIFLITIGPAAALYLVIERPLSLVPIRAKSP